MTHVFIPDTQCKPGVKLDHLEWAGRYIADHVIRKHRPVRVIHAGDHWDFPSLSSYDRGKSGLMEGRRLDKDLAAGNEGMRLLSTPIEDALVEVTDPATIELILQGGNHEDRFQRMLDTDATLDGALNVDMMKAPGWTKVPFKEITEREGVSYSHYFYNPLTGRPYGGQSMDALIKTIGYSFVQGHRQVFMYGERYLTNGGVHHGLIAGRFYLHEEDYLGPQGNKQWSGIVVLHEVRNGTYDIMKVSMDYLCERYTGRTLSQFKWRK